MSSPKGHNFQFAGCYCHPRSDLLLTLHRPYLPFLGRFMNRDPIGENGGVNLYGYARNSPTQLIDPLGIAEIAMTAGSNQILQSYKDLKGICDKCSNHPVDCAENANRMVGRMQSMWQKHYGVGGVENDQSVGRHMCFVWARGFGDSVAAKDPSWQVSYRQFDSPTNVHVAASIGIRKSDLKKGACPKDCSLNYDDGFFAGDTSLVHPGGWPSSSMPDGWTENPEGYTGPTGKPPGFSSGK